jgi:chaperonin cofactor prefoldin
MASLRGVIEELRSKQEQWSKSVALKRSVAAQLQENEFVREELEVIEREPGALLYKLHGPCLFRKSLAEAKENVKQRQDLLRNELKRLDEVLSNLEREVQALQQRIREQQRQPAPVPSSSG